MAIFFKRWRCTLNNCVLISQELETKNIINFLSGEQAIIATSIPLNLEQLDERYINDIDNVTFTIYTLDEMVVSKQVSVVNNKTNINLQEEIANLEKQYVDFYAELTINYHYSSFVKYGFAFAKAAIIT